MPQRKENSGRLSIWHVSNSRLLLRKLYVMEDLIRRLRLLKKKTKDGWRYLLTASKSVSQQLYFEE